MDEDEMEKRVRQLRHKRYLGYGVHVGIDPQTAETVIWTARESGIHAIWLTNDEIDELNRWRTASDVRNQP